MSDLVDKIADNIKNQDVVGWVGRDGDWVQVDGTFHIEPIIKLVLDDLREWNKDPEKKRPGFRYAYFAADIDAYEKDRK